MNETLIIIISGLFLAGAILSFFALKHLSKKKRTPVKKPAIDALMDIKQGRGGGTK
jgi:hypothetical protein